jgi:hypothetical protein
MGLYFVQEVVPVAAVPEQRWNENAHVRKVRRGATDVVVRAKPGVSGRFDRCIRIGEWRDGAYRVQGTGFRGEQPLPGHCSSS